MELNKETRDRIFAAADELFEQGDRENFPTVDAVRKAARVNMNDASAGMREWRRQRTAQAAPLAVQVPDAVQQAGNQAVAALWQAAQALANESLQAAQAGWDRERNELEAVRGELADAFEAQARELEEAQARVTLLEQQAAEAAELAARQRQALAEARTALAGAPRWRRSGPTRWSVERRSCAPSWTTLTRTPAHSKKRAARPWTRPTRKCRRFAASATPPGAKRRVCARSWQR
ncbi:TPA: DNA-binding protein [Pseudomonas aeruginosa]|nr:DNA-binding protein [Pseudomonas aeruginosa]HBO1155396.1 DNA-binding protein [Pseudomonas aeruginosa]